MYPVIYIPCYITGFLRLARNKSRKTINPEEILRFPSYYFQKTQKLANMKLSLLIASISLISQASSINLPQAPNYQPNLTPFPFQPQQVGVVVLPPYIHASPTSVLQYGPKSQYGPQTSLSFSSPSSKAVGLMTQIQDGALVIDTNGKFLSCGPGSNACSFYSKGTNVAQSYFQKVTDPNNAITGYNIIQNKPGTFVSSNGCMALKYGIIYLSDGGNCLVVN